MVDVELREHGLAGQKRQGEEHKIIFDQESTKGCIADVSSDGKRNRT
jgi:hypothetical protein